MESQSNASVVKCAPPRTDHLDGFGVLCGYPIAHSLSPLLHQTIFKYLGLNSDYFLHPSTDLESFLKLVRQPKSYGKSTSFHPRYQRLTVSLGSGVTMPNKVAIIPRLDGITDECRAVGACNTIFKQGSKLIGTNTDTVGVRESFYQNVDDKLWQGRPGMVIGGGGAARSAVYALVHYMKCKTVYLVNRDRAEVQAVIDWCTSQGYGDGLIDVSNAHQAEQLEGPGAIVSCVPNFPPFTEAEWEARRVTECFLSKPHKGAMLEMCYHPTPWTELGALAERAGWHVILGTEAMIYQGFEQARYWTGREYSDLPIQAVKDAVARELSRARL